MRHTEIPIPAPLRFVPVNERVLIPDTYKFSRNAGWHWVQRFCFWLLDKIGAYYYRKETVGFREVRVKCDDLVQCILEHRNVTEEIARRQAKYLVVGADIMHRLNIEPEDHYFGFNIPSHYEAPVFGPEEWGDPRKMFAGLRVVVVPWFEGMVVLPDLEG